MLHDLTLIKLNVSRISVQGGSYTDILMVVRIKHIAS
jgi:hypothetical protein